MGVRIDVALVQAGDLLTAPSGNNKVLFDILRVAEVPVVGGPIDAQAGRHDRPCRRPSCTSRPRTCGWRQRSTQRSSTPSAPPTETNSVCPTHRSTVNGVILFAQKLYTDTPNGAQVAIGDPSFEPIFQPESLWKHVRHYFDHLDVAYGVCVMNVADLHKLIHDALVAEGKTKVPVVYPGTPISVIPCVALAPGNDELANGNRTLRYGFDVTVLVHRNNQADQYEQLVELEAIVVAVADSVQQRAVRGSDRLRRPRWRGDGGTAHPSESHPDQFHLRH